MPLVTVIDEEKFRGFESQELSLEFAYNSLVGEGIEVDACTIVFFCTI